MFSWMSSCGTERIGEPPSLVQVNETDPDDPIRQAAAEDLALIESDYRPADEANPEER